MIGMEFIGSWLKQTGIDDGIERMRNREYLAESDSLKIDLPYQT